MGLRRNVYEGNANVSPPTPFKSLIGLILGLVLMVAAAMAAIVMLSSVLAPYVPASWEEKMGEGARAFFQENVCTDHGQTASAACLRP